MNQEKDPEATEPARLAEAGASGEDTPEENERKPTSDAIEVDIKRMPNRPPTWTHDDDGVNLKPWD